MFSSKENVSNILIVNWGLFISVIKSWIVRIRPSDNSTWVGNKKVDWSIDWLSKMVFSFNEMKLINLQWFLFSRNDIKNCIWSNFDCSVVCISWSSFWNR